MVNGGNNAGSSRLDDSVNGRRGVLKGIDPCIKVQCLISAVTYYFSGDETKLCVSLGKIIVYR